MSSHSFKVEHVSWIPVKENETSANIGNFRHRSVEDRSIPKIFGHFRSQQIHEIYRYWPMFQIFGGNPLGLFYLNIIHTILLCQSFTLCRYIFLPTRCKYKLNLKNGWLSIYACVDLHKTGIMLLIKKWSTDITKRCFLC